MNWQERAEKAEAELASLRWQEPVATLLLSYDGADFEMYYDNNKLRFEGMSMKLYAAAGAAPAVPEEWRKVMVELADDLAIEIDQNYPPERRAYPSEQRRYKGEMAIVNRARAMLQSSQAAPAVPANLVDTLAGIALKCTDCYTTDAIDALLQSEGCSSQTQNDVRHD